MRQRTTSCTSSIRSDRVMHRASSNPRIHREACRAPSRRKQLRNTATTRKHHKQEKGTTARNLEIMLTRIAICCERARLGRNRSSRQTWHPNRTSRRLDWPAMKWTTWNAARTRTTRTKLLRCSNATTSPSGTLRATCRKWHRPKGQTGTVRTRTTCPALPSTSRTRSSNENPR